MKRASVILAATVGFAAVLMGVRYVQPPCVYSVGCAAAAPTLLAVSGAFLLFLLALKSAFRPAPPASTASPAAAESFSADDENNRLNGSIHGMNFVLTVKSPLSYNLLKEALYGYQRENYFSSIILTHLSVEHSVIARLRMIYTGADPQDKELPRMYKDKLDSLIALDQKYESLRENAMILWNMSRITYVHPVVDANDYSEFKDAYKENEKNLVTGVEAIAIEAITRAIEIHTVLAG